MPVTHVCFAVILSFSAGFAQSTEYMVSPASEYVKFQDEVSVENIYQSFSAVPLQISRQKKSVQIKKVKPVMIEKPALKQNPNSVFKNVVIKKLKQSM